MPGFRTPGKSGPPRRDQTMRVKRYRLRATRRGPTPYVKGATLFYRGQPRPRTRRGHSPVEKHIPAVATVVNNGRTPRLRSVAISTTPLSTVVVPSQVRLISLGIPAAGAQRVIPCCP